VGEDCLTTYCAALAHPLTDYLPAAAHLLPLPSAALDREPGAFGSVFSLSVLYHRRDPPARLRDLRRALESRGEPARARLLALGQGDHALVARERHAGMRDVWQAAGVARVFNWLESTDFAAARMVDVAPTTVREQRRTQWMEGHSLADFLEVRDAGQTREGYPAPVRAICIARAN